MPKRSSPSKYLLLLRQPPGKPPAPGELKKIMAQFETWMDGLSAKHTVLGTNGLHPTGTVLRGSGGLTTTDGPYAETNEVVGGYVLIETDSLSAAIEAARGCPGLNFKMSVEVRPVMQRG